MKYIVLPLAFCISSCATWIPAAVQKKEDGAYAISTTGNSFASLEKMKIKLNKKAESVCEGRGYDYQKNADTQWHSQKDYTTGISSSYKRMSITVVCRD